MLYTAPGLGQYISGCIMFEETLYQSTADGVPFVKILKDAGIVPGIKVDTGLQVKAVAWEFAIQICGSTFVNVPFALRSFLAELDCSPGLEVSCEKKADRISMKSVGS